MLQICEEFDEIKEYLKKTKPSLRLGLGRLMFQLSFQGMPDPTDSKWERYKIRLENEADQELSKKMESLEEKASQKPAAAASNGRLEKVEKKLESMEAKLADDITGSVTLRSPR